MAVITLRRNLSRPLTAVEGDSNIENLNNALVALTGVVAGKADVGHTHPALTGAEIVAAINANLGSTTWQGGGGSGGTNATNLTASASPTNVLVLSDTGTDATLPLADGTNAGLMSPAQFAKLNGIQAGATDDLTGAEIVALINAALGGTTWQAGGGGGSGTVTSVTVTQPAAGLTVTNSGTAQTTAATATIALANDLAALEALSGTGVARRTGTDAWSLGPVNLATEVTGTLPLSAISIATATLLGRSTAGTGAPETITLGSGLSLTAGVLSVSAGGGNVSNAGTPTTGQMAEWTSSSTIQGVAATGTGSPVRATSPTLVTPNLGVPSALTLTNAIGLPVSTGISGLATGIAAWMATPSSANLRAAVTDETGSGGGLVFANSPTIDAPSLTGVVTLNGAQVITPNAMAALAIDTSKPNTKSIAVDSTFTFSATPAANTWFSVLVTNTDTNAHILTFPSSFDMGAQTTVTTCPIAAGGRLLLTWRYNGSGYELFGSGPYLSKFDATTNPTVADDVSKGYGPGSLFGNATANTLFWCESNASGAAVWNSIGGGAGVTDGDKGDITVTSSGATWTVDPQAISYSKIQNISTTARVLGRKTAGAGSAEELSLSDVLDLVGSAAQGDILYRGASGWVRLPAGTAGQVLQTGGAAANPSWVNASGGGGNALTTNPLSQFAATSSSQLAGVISDETGSGSLVFATSPTLVTPVLGTPASGNLANCTVDGTNEPGARNIPINSQSANYTAVFADRGGCLYHPTADTTARTFTIPANASVAYPVGTTLMFENDFGAGTLTIAINSDTLVMVGAAGLTGSRTLAAGGRAMAVKVSATRWRISGGSELT